jgi:peptidoglycan/xylan/chitin deacetylase (PgdA/CDA1 family)
MGQTLTVKSVLSILASRIGMQESILSPGPQRISPNRRDFLKLSGLALASLALDFAKPLVLEGDPVPQLWEGSLQIPDVALTYDDCYLVKVMQKLEAILDNYPQVKVTLFPVGVALLSNEEKDPGIWKRFYEKGHEFGYHSFEHINPGVQSSASVIKDFDRWMDACTQVLGLKPEIRFARPPYGVISASFEEMCKERGLVVTMWSTGWGSTSDPASDIRKTRNGDIVLMHIRTNDINNTKQGLAMRADDGLRFVTLSELYFAYLMEQSGFAQCDPSHDQRLLTCPE